MAVVLHLEVHGVSPEDIDAPLTEDELSKLESFVAKVRAGDFQTTDDPARGDEWLASGRHVMCWREEADRMADVGNDG